MLSVVITAWNEEQNLPRVVKSVRSIAGEIIVVDTQSTDNTVAVAKELGCTVYHHSNTKIVEPVRNFSISKANGDWILLLDADEEIPNTLASYIKEVVKENKADYCRIPRKNIIFSHWIKSGHWWPDYVYRLFKKGHIIWQDEIHSVPLTKGVGIDFPPQEEFALKHHNYQSVSQFINRLNRYTDIQAENLKKSKMEFTWSDVVTKPANEFFSQYFHRSGFKEGFIGLVMSLLQSFSELIVQLKYWQLSGFSNPNISYKEINTHIIRNIKDYYWWVYNQKIKNNPSLKFYWRFIRFIQNLIISL